MSDAQKVIKINPEFFKIPTNNNKTKKNVEKKIRVKPDDRETKNSVNKNVLNHIRKKQKEMFSQMVENSLETDPYLSSPESSSSGSLSSGSLSPDGDFEKAVQHLDSILLQPTKPTLVNHHHTKSIKRTTTFSPHVQLSNNGTIPMTFSAPTYTSSAPTYTSSAPTYGCLRNGTLPTYRSWKKNEEQSKPHPQKPEPMFYSAPTTPIQTMQNINEIQQLKQSLKPKPIIKPPITKQVKTIKRKFNIGKSKYYSKIGVLISNRTLRTQTVQKTNELKKTPLAEIKRTLVKKGLIKVGSAAPNDVLRKMYESVSLLVGDVQNHNVETMLHNYINESKEGS